MHGKQIAVIDKNAPNKTLTKRESKHKQKSLTTKNINKSIKTKTFTIKHFLKHNQYSCTVDTDIIDTNNKFITKSKNKHLRK